MARVLVTGAGGFIGAHVARALLLAGDEVHILVRPVSPLWRLTDIQERLYIHQGDITNIEDIGNVVSKSNPDEVFHLAGYGASSTERDMVSMQRVIVDGTKHLYEACRALNRFPRIVHAGSASEYGIHNQPLHEDMEALPATEYGRAKLRATIYGETLRTQEALPITTLRLFNTYGEYDAPVRFIPATIIGLLQGKQLNLSHGETVRDFIYVVDVVDACMRARTGPCGVYNIGTGVQTNLHDTIALIQEALCNTTPLIWGGEEGRGNDSSCFSANVQKAESALGWRPQTSLREGIERTASWFAENVSLYA